MTNAPAVLLQARSILEPSGLDISADSVAQPGGTVKQVVCEGAPIQHQQHTISHQCPSEDANCKIEQVEVSPTSGARVTMTSCVPTRDNRRATPPRGIEF